MLMLWAKAFLILGLVLALVGFLPALVQSLIPTVDPLLPGLLLLGVAPLGVVFLLLAALLSLLALLARSRR